MASASTDGGTEVPEGVPVNLNTELKMLFGVIVKYIQDDKRLNRTVQEKLKKHLQYTGNLLQQMPNDTNRPDFGDSGTQWAYIYKYFIHHVHLVYTALSKIATSHGERILTKLRKKPLLCSIGGGPNTDSVGLRLFLKLYKELPDEAPTFPEAVDVLDKYALDWKDAWKELNKQLGKEYKHKAEYHTFDFLDGGPISSDKTLYGIIHGADLITMIKSLSSVAADTDRTKSKVNAILDSMKVGALLLVIDNQYEGSKWKDIFRLPSTHTMIMENNINVTLTMKDIHDDHNGLLKLMKLYPLLQTGDNVMMLIERIAK